MQLNHILLRFSTSDTDLHTFIGTGERLSECSNLSSSYTQLEVGPLRDKRQDLAPPLPCSYTSLHLGPMTIRHRGLILVIQKG